MPTAVHSQPYIPRFQSGTTRYPIALANAPAAGGSYRPMLPPVVHSSSPPKKEVRFALHRSNTMPSVSQGPLPSSSKPLKSALGARASDRPSVPAAYPAAPVYPSPPRDRRASIVAATAEIAPTLAYSSAGSPGLAFNLAYSPSHARLTTSHYALSDDDRRRPATTVPVPVLRVHVSGFPWPIEVLESAARRGVRLGDVVDALSRAMYRRVRGNEYAALDSRVRDRINASFHARVARAGPRGSAVKSEGIIRLDWLQGRTVFKGLAKTTEANTFTLVLDYVL